MQPAAVAQNTPRAECATCPRIAGDLEGRSTAKINYLSAGSRNVRQLRAVLLLCLLSSRACGGTGWEPGRPQRSVRLSWLLWCACWYGRSVGHVIYVQNRFLAQCSSACCLGVFSCIVYLWLCGTWYATSARDKRGQYVLLMSTEAASRCLLRPSCIHFSM